MGKAKKRTKRGHPVGLLIGLNDDRAVLYRIYSETLKEDVVIKRGRKRKNQDDKQLYHFHQDLVDQIRNIMKEGMKSIILVSPPKEDFSDELMEHINKHHQWMLKNKVVFKKLEGSTKNKEEVLELVQREIFQETLEESVNEETLNILETLDELINKPDKFSKIIYSIKEIEQEIDKKWRKDEVKPDFLLISDEFLDTHPQKNRLHRILQIANNNNIKSKVVYSETDAGQRIESLGGMVCFTRLDN